MELYLELFCPKALRQKVTKYDSEQAADTATWIGGTSGLLSFPSSLTIMREDYLTFTFLLPASTYFGRTERARGNLQSFGGWSLFWKNHIKWSSCDIKLRVFCSSFLFKVPTCDISAQFHLNLYHGWSLRARLFWFLWSFSVFGLRRFRFCMFLSSSPFLLVFLWLALSLKVLPPDRWRLDHGMADMRWLEFKLGQPSNYYYFNGRSERKHGYEKSSFQCKFANADSAPQFFFFFNKLNHF